MIRRILIAIAAAAVLAAGIWASWKLAPASILSRIVPAPVQKLTQAAETRGLSGHSIVRSRICDRLAEMEADHVQAVGRADSGVEIKAVVPRGEPLEWIIWRLSAVTEGTTYRVTDCVVDEQERSFRIDYAAANPRKPAILVTATASQRFYSRTARLAVLIERFGGAADQTAAACLSFPEPLTFAVTPSQKLASLMAQIAREYKKEVLIQLPMESAAGPFNDSSGLRIMVHYPEDQIRKILDKAMRLAPDFAGFCNYAGSRALDDSRVTRILFDEIKKRNACFIALNPPAGSVAAAVAKNTGCAYGAADGYIGPELSIAQIGKALEHYAAVAQANGAIIITGQANARFITALGNKVSFLKQNGIKLVFVSEIVKNPRLKE
jgi:polysaccharide deacetylase 2 family uncharacterized protein YibQ